MRGEAGGNRIAGGTTVRATCRPARGRRGAPRRHLPLRALVLPQRRRRRGPRPDRGRARRSPAGPRCATPSGRSGTCCGSSATSPPTRRGARSRFAVEPWAELPDAASADAAPDARLLHDDEHEVPRAAFAELARVHQEVLQLRFVEELDHAAIAARLQTTEQAARQRVYRAMQALRAHHAAAPAARPARPRQPLDAFRRRNRVTCTQLRRQNEVLGEISRRAVLGHPSPPRGGGGGRGHGPRSDGPAPG